MKTPLNTLTLLSIDTSGSVNPKLHVIFPIRKSK